MQPRSRRSQTPAPRVPSRSPGRPPRLRESPSALGSLSRVSALSDAVRTASVLFWLCPQECAGASDGRARSVAVYQASCDQATVTYLFGRGGRFGAFWCGRLRPMPPWRSRRVPRKCAFLAMRCVCSALLLMGMGCTRLCSGGWETRWLHPRPCRLRSGPVTSAAVLLPCVSPMAKLVKHLFTCDGRAGCPRLTPVF